MFPFSLAHGVRRCGTVLRHIALEIELLEERDLLSSSFSGPPMQFSPAPHGPQPPARQPSPGGEANHAPPRSPSDHQPEQRPLGADFGRDSSLPPIGIPAPRREVAPPTLPPNSSGPVVGFVPHSLPFLVDTLFASAPADAPPAVDSGPPPSENFVRPPIAETVAALTRTVALNEPTVAINVAAVAPATPSPDARTIVVAAASAPRAAVTFLASAGAGAAADVRLLAVVAEVVARAPVVVVDPAAGLPSFPSPGAAPAVAGNVALSVAAAPLTPLLAGLLPAAASSAPLLAMQHLWPVEGEPDAPLLTRILHSPYLPGALVALAALEVLRQRTRRREIATELPEITGPRGL